MDADGKAVITDFGLANIREEADLLEWPSTLPGSIRWMAPELFLSLEEDKITPITTYSDVYAFACICLEVRFLHWKFLVMLVNSALYACRYLPVKSHMRVARVRLLFLWL